MSKLLASCEFEGTLRSEEVDIAWDEDEGAMSRVACLLLFASSS